MSNKNLLIIIFVTFFSLSSAFANEPTNLYIAKQNVIEYYNSGEYNKDVTKKANIAKKFLQHKLTENNTKKLAIVFDIDDTLISTFDLNKENDFGGGKAIIQTLLATVHKEPIQPMLDLYNFAKQNNIEIFLISGRAESLRQNTIDLLAANGYKGWKSLFLQATDGEVKDKQNFKTNIRKFITNNGYDVLLNIGDQKSDLIGGYADKTIKLPNPCYQG